MSKPAPPWRCNIVWEDHHPACIWPPTCCAYLIDSLDLPVLVKLIFVFRSLHNISSVLFKVFFNVFQSNNEGRDSRGQVSFLLQILPGPSGRKTMHFICATRWNKLPHNIRSICNLSQFKCSISEVDLSSPHNNF